jgi:WD40 repeat protein
VRLVEPGEGTEDTRRRARKSELRTTAEEEEAVEVVLRKLAKDRFIVIDKDEVDVAHEELIRGWPRLREWIEEDRDALRLQRRVTEATQEWERLEFDEGVLFRGALLAQVQEWRAHHEEELNPQEQAFVDKSLALKEREEEKERRARRFRAVSIILGFVLLVAIMVVFDSHRDRRKAHIQWLDAQAALKLFDQELDLGLLLSLEANHLARRTSSMDPFKGIAPLRAGVLYNPHFITWLRGHKKSAWSVAFSQDGNRLASGSWDGTILLWEWDIAMKKFQPIGHPLKTAGERVWSLAFSPDGNVLASGDNKNEIRLWDLITLGKSTVLSGHASSVRSLAYSPEGKYLASGSWDCTVLLWDLGQDRPKGLRLEGKGHSGPVLSVAFSPDGKRLLASAGCKKPEGAECGQTETMPRCGEQAELIVWDVDERSQYKQTSEQHTKFVQVVAFSPDGKQLASGGEDSTIILWDPNNLQPLGLPLSGHTRPVWSIAFSPDGKQLASGSMDKTIIVWDLENRRPVIQPLQGHRNSVASLAFNRNGMLASGSEDLSPIIWDVNVQSPENSLQKQTDAIWSVAFNPNGNLLASGSKDGTIVLWDVATQPPIGHPLEGHDKTTVQTIAFSPDGTLLASGGDDKNIILWNVATQQRIDKLDEEHENAVMSIAFSRDGKMASGSKDSKVFLWDLATRRAKPLKGHT